MGYTQGIGVQYQYQGAGIGIGATQKSGGKK